VIWGGYGHLMICLHINLKAHVRRSVPLAKLLVTYRYTACIWQPFADDFSGILPWTFASENQRTGLSCGVVCVTICLAVLREHRQTDGQTDRHTATAYTALA